MAEPQDWLAWHADYATPGTSLARRLAAVQQRLADALDQCPAGPIRIVSACAGQGRDLLELLPGHPRRDDVEARLVELDGRNTAVAADLVQRSGLRGIDIVTGDASLIAAYAGAVPADVVLLCGIFGNITDADIRRTIARAPMLCAPGARVIWTRHRRPPDLTRDIRSWFADAGYREDSFDQADDVQFGVGVHTWPGPTAAFDPSARLFTFVGHGRDAFA